MSNIKKLDMYYAQEPEEASLAAVHLSVKNISECCFFFCECSFSPAPFAYAYASLKAASLMTFEKGIS